MRGELEEKEGKEESKKSCPKTQRVLLQMSSKRECDRHAGEDIGIS